MDEDSRAIAISVTHVIGWKDDGSPIPATRSAVCDVCGAWATTIRVAESFGGDDADLTAQRISRKTTAIVYACSMHEERVSSALVDEYGFSVNRYDEDELAMKVDRHSRASWNA